MEVFSRLTAAAGPKLGQTRFHDVPAEVWRTIDAAEYLDARDTVQISLTNRATRGNPRLRLGAVRAHCVIASDCRGCEREEYLENLDSYIAPLPDADKASAYTELLPLLRGFSLDKRYAVIKSALRSLRHAPPETRGEALIEIIDGINALPLGLRPQVFRKTKKLLADLAPECRGDALCRMGRAISTIHVPRAREFERAALRDLLPSIDAVPVMDRAKAIDGFLQCAMQACDDDHAAIGEICDLAGMLKKLAVCPAPTRFAALAKIEAIVRVTGIGAHDQDIAALYINSLETALHPLRTHAGIPWRAPDVFAALPEPQQHALLPRVMRMLAGASLDEEQLFISTTCNAYQSNVGFSADLFAAFCARNAAPDFAAHPALRSEILSALAATIRRNDGPLAMSRAAYVFENARSLHMPTADHLYEPIRACARVVQYTNPADAAFPERTVCTAVLDSALQLTAAQQTPILHELGILAKASGENAQYYQRFLALHVTTDGNLRDVENGDAPIVRFASWLEHMQPNQAAVGILRLCEIIDKTPPATRGRATAVIHARAAVMPRDIARGLMSYLEPISARLEPQARVEFLAAALHGIQHSDDHTRAMLAEHGLDFTAIVHQIAGTPRFPAIDDSRGEAFAQRNLLFAAAAEAAAHLSPEAYAQVHAAVFATLGEVTPHLSEPTAIAPYLLETLALYVPVTENVGVRREQCRAIFEEAAVAPHHMQGRIYNALLRAVPEHEHEDFFAPSVLNEIRAEYLLDRY